MGVSVHDRVLKSVTSHVVRQWNNSGRTAIPERAHRRDDARGIFHLRVVPEIVPSLALRAGDFARELSGDRHDRDWIFPAPGDERRDVEALERADPSATKARALFGIANELRHPLDAALARGERA